MGEKTKNNWELPHLIDSFKYKDDIYGASDMWKIVRITDNNLTLFNGLQYNYVEISDFQFNYSIVKRPLSDLTKEDDKGKPLYFPSTSLIRKIENKQDILSCDYNEIDYLMRNHFDVKNLISLRLAIDVNTLNH